MQAVKPPIDIVPAPADDFFRPPTDFRDRNEAAAFLATSREAMSKLKLSVLRTFENCQS